MYLKKLGYKIILALLNIARIMKCLHLANIIQVFAKEFRQHKVNNDSIYAILILAFIK